MALFVRGECMVSLAGHGLPADLELPSRGEAYLDRVRGPRPGQAGARCRSASSVSNELGGRPPASVFAISPAAEPDLEGHHRHAGQPRSQGDDAPRRGADEDDDAIPQRLWASPTRARGPPRASDAQAVTVGSGRDSAGPGPARRRCLAGGCGALTRREEWSSGPAPIHGRRRACLEGPDG